MSRLVSGWMWLPLTVQFLVATGCGQGPILSDIDKAPMAVIQRYEPEYQLDNAGRVIILRLDKKNLNSEVLREVGKLSELRRLSLYRATLIDADLAELKNLKQLQQLGLGATPITDQGLVHLHHLSSLRRVFLPKNNEITQPMIDQLKKALPGLVVDRQK